MIKPAAILNPLADIPKNLNRNCPANVKISRVINEIRVALQTMELRSWSDSPRVMERKTGIVPRGLARVKNDARHMKPKAKAVSIYAIL